MSHPDETLRERLAQITVSVLLLATVRQWPVLLAN
jgi:hypothetical protein